MYDTLYFVLVFKFDVFQNKKLQKKKKTTENVKRSEILMFLEGKLSISKVVNLPQINL